MSRFFTFWCILCTVSGCSIFSQTPFAGNNGVEKPISIAFKLLPPDQGPAPVLLKQVVTMEARGDQHRFIGVVRITKERVQMVGLLPTGQQLFSLDYDGETLVQENSSYADVPGQEILTIMQFSLWPKTAVRQYYSGKGGWDVVFSSAQRVLEKGGEKLLDVQYAGDDLAIENHTGHYRILIKTLEKTEL